MSQLRRLRQIKSDGNSGATWGDIGGDLSDQVDISGILGDGPSSIGTRLRQYSGTGWLSGGVVSVASSTTVDITAGTGRTVDFSNPLDPQVSEVSWDEMLGVAVTNVGTDGTTIFAFDGNGDLTQILRENLTALQMAILILPGAAAHASGALLTPALTSPLAVGYDGHTTLTDFFTALGPMNKGGNVFSANGANLSLNVSPGSAFKLASSARTSPNLPDTTLQAQFTAGDILTVYRNAAGTGPILHQFDEFVVPGLIDDGGGATAVLSNNDWQIMHLFRGTDTGDVFAALGQDGPFNQKVNATDALAAIGGPMFDEFAPLDDLMFRGFLVIRGGATDLSDTGHAEFFPPPGRFRLT